MFQKSFAKHKLILRDHFIVTAIAVLLFIVNIPNSGLWYPDAPKHALSGVFYKDMIEECGFLNPRDYTEKYYAQYPSLSIGMFPPLFYIIEAFFFKLFGISALAAKLTVLLFTIIGSNMFLLLCRIWFPSWLSVIGTVFCLLQPIMLFGQKNVMLEMPALCLSLVALYSFYVCIKRDNSLALCWAPVFAALAFLTKQSVIFLLPFGFFWLIINRKWGILKSAHFLVGILSGIVILIPWIIINVTVGKFYVNTVAFSKLAIVDNLLYYARNSSEIISYPIIFLTVFSLIFFIKLKKKDCYTFSILWVCSVLLFLSLMNYKEPRHAIFLVPAMILLSMQIVELFSENKKIYVTIIIIVMCLHFNPKTLWGGRNIQGFDKPTDFIVSDPDCISILYDGYFNSNFIFHMRAKDKDKRIFIFRASKIIYSTKILANLGYNELIKEASEFYALLDRYSIKYIIQEEKNLLNTTANMKLRTWIDGPKFKLINKYPILWKDFNGFGDLLIYEYLDYKAKPLTEIELDMPVMGRKIKIKIK